MLMVTSCLQLRQKEIDSSRVEKFLKYVAIAAYKIIVSDDISAMMPGGIRVLNRKFSDDHVHNFLSSFNINKEVSKRLSVDFQKEVMEQLRCRVKAKTSPWQKRRL